MALGIGWEVNWVGMALAGVLLAFQGLGSVVPPLSNPPHYVSHFLDSKWAHVESLMTFQCSAHVTAQLLTRRSGA